MYFFNNEINNTENIPKNETELEHINEILKGEFAAIEAYRKVEEKIKTNPEAYRLNQFKRDHENATVYWQMQAKNIGIKPERNSLSWGTFVSVIIQATKVFGDKTALWSLKQGEVHGLNQYKKMLLSKELQDKQKEMIRKIFIPRQKRHISCLEALLRLP